MYDLIEKFPYNMNDALEISKKNPLSKSSALISNIVICGLSSTI